MKIRALVFAVLALFAFSALPACGGPQRKDERSEVRDRADDSMGDLDREERKQSEE
jgi:hypothetical protein